MKQKESAIKQELKELQTQAGAQERTNEERVNSFIEHLTVEACAYRDKAGKREAIEHVVNTFLQSRRTKDEE